MSPLLMLLACAWGVWTVARWTRKLGPSGISYRIDNTRIGAEVEECRGNSPVGSNNAIVAGPVLCLLESNDGCSKVRERTPTVND